MRRRRRVSRSRPARRLLSAGVFSAGIGLSAAAGAQPAAPTTDAYRSALDDAGLSRRVEGTADELDRLVRQAESLALESRSAEVITLLFPIVEGPRFRDFDGGDAFNEARMLLAGALVHHGALASARAQLLPLIRDEVPTYLAPAYRRYVDASLDAADPAAALAALPEDTAALPEDAQNERRYLEAHVALSAGDLAAAESGFASLTERSRFYINAQYLRGLVAVRQGDLATAEAHFCRVADVDDDGQLAFFVDGRYFEVKDQAWLALGRIAHEDGARAHDAFYYYFQVPADSAYVAEALFESAYAMYEGGELATSLDLVEQLEARFPESPFAHEAALLRGYVHLARCEFAEAEAAFVRFDEAHADLVAEIDRVLDDPAAQREVYERLARVDGDADTSALHRTLLGLLRVSPRFHRLHRAVRTLDAEAERGADLVDRFTALAARARGEGEPLRAEASAESSEDAEALERMLARAEGALRLLRREITALREAGASAAEVRPLAQEARQLSRRLEVLRTRVRGEVARAERDAAAYAEEVPSGESAALVGLLRADRRLAAARPARVRRVRRGLVERANGLALAGLTDLRGQLQRFLRQARIGRIDAIMGAKRALEGQVIELAAGRLPPELEAPLRVQGLLGEHEEYWPYDGEYWEDEYEDLAPMRDRADGDGGDGGDGVESDGAAEAAEAPAATDEDAPRDGEGDAETGEEGDE